MAFWQLLLITLAVIIGETMLFTPIAIYFIYFAPEPKGPPPRPLKELLLNALTSLGRCYQHRPPVNYRNW